MPSAVIDLRPPATDDRAQLVAGLRAAPASIPPKHFYDALGCALYAAICATREYYLTRTEASIFAMHADAIAARLRGTTFVDLGTGDGAKALAWLPRIAAARYVGVDYAADALAASLRRIEAAFPDLDVQGIATDFGTGLDIAAHLPGGAVTFFYPGSSIGNFAPAPALAFLRSLRAHAGTGRSVALLIGVDTHKDARRLEAAYDDALGVTAAFNRNVLHVVNALVGTDFDPAAFRHVALYDTRRRRIEMHLEATRELAVAIDGVPRRFAAGERIHTENSYKYVPEDFAQMLREAGFTTVERWSDRDGDFAVFHAT
jgi:dimethylhistidine N-methyltransferase